MAEKPGGIPTRSTRLASCRGSQAAEARKLPRLASCRGSQAAEARKLPRRAPRTKPRDDIGSLQRFYRRQSKIEEPSPLAEELASRVRRRMREDPSS